MAQLPNRPIPKASLFQQMAHRGLSHAANLSPQEIDAMLTNFLQMMDLEFKKKYQQNGEKLEGTCEDRFFCEVALQGRKVKADPMHRMLFNIALETPPDLASKSGLGEIFKAIKRLNCDVFKCSKIQKLM
ncbi:CLUMA_CG017038, isoform A [Clunio marinus]|nr:CLUMA_CG017038, isoform A [Clunio marinus]